MVKIYPRRNEHITGTLKRFRKLCEKEGIIKEIRKHDAYEKPSDVRRRNRRKAERRAFLERDDQKRR